MDLDDEEHLHSKLRTKGKSQTYLLRPNVLELKPRNRAGKCLGAALEVLLNDDQLNSMADSLEPKNYRNISNDIWFHLSNYIAPEDVKRYSLICTQSANSTRRRGFWLQLYRQYCKSKSNAIQELPHDLKMSQLNDCDVQTLRQRVVQALFYCHQPFSESIDNSNCDLDTLLGRIYVASWQFQVQCIWITCYKFRLYLPSNSYQDASKANHENQMAVVDDWQTLADESFFKTPIKNTSIANFSKSSYNGISLLVFYNDRCIPIPSDFLCNNASSSIRLHGIRKLLSTDMRSTNLEIDLSSKTGDQKITCKYNNIKKCHVFPWWHPDFSKFNKFVGSQ